MFYKSGSTKSREVYVHFLIGASPHCTEAAPDQEDSRPKAHARAAGKRQALSSQKGIGLCPLSRVTACAEGHRQPKNGTRLQRIQRKTIAQLRKATFVQKGCQVTWDECQVKPEAELLKTLPGNL